MKLASVKIGIPIVCLEGIDIFFPEEKSVDLNNPATKGHCYTIHIGGCTIHDDYRLYDRTKSELEEQYWHLRLGTFHRLGQKDYLSIFALLFGDNR
jgi:hypothetical protein